MALQQILFYFFVVVKASHKARKDLSDYHCMRYYVFTEGASDSPPHNINAFYVIINLNILAQRHRLYGKRGGIKEMMNDIFYTNFW
jgi:hypothetical protein